MRAFKTKMVSFEDCPLITQIGEEHKTRREVAIVINCGKYDEPVLSPKQVDKAIAWLTEWRAKHDDKGEPLGS